MTDIEWKITGYGKMFPTIVFEEINIYGTIISRATGKNSKWIFDQGLGIGSRIVIEKSGLIIPNVEKVLTKGIPRYPDILTHWDGVHLYATSKFS